MNQSIGSMLSDLGALRTQLMSPASRTPPNPATPATGSFAAQLDASFRERAERLGLDLPAASPATAIPASDGEDVDAIWTRAQLQSAAVHGPGDAMMQAVSDAADARWEERHGRGGGRDLFDF